MDSWMDGGSRALERIRVEGISWRIEEETEGRGTNMMITKDLGRTKQVTGGG